MTPQDVRAVKKAHESISILDDVLLMLPPEIHRHHMRAEYIVHQTIANEMLRRLIDAGAEVPEIEQ